MLWGNGKYEITLIRGVTPRAAARHIFLQRTTEKYLNQHQQPASRPRTK